MTDLCAEKHKTIDGKFNAHDIRIYNIETDVVELKEFRSSTENEMKNLVEQLKNLVSSIRWMTTSTILILVSFIIWYIQKL